MKYQALYREWRPVRFADIVGQDRIVQTLLRQVTTGRVPHAYLFCGTRGTGKTTTAKVLARAINCLNPIEGDPCGVCESCVALQRDNSLDVVEIDAASNNGVDEIRDLREKVKYPPSVGRYKVYIIDEVHMLSAGAFNALLKTLEEPPAHAVFILATTEPQKLPATILSRCQRFDFKRIPARTIAGRLRQVLASEGAEVDEEAIAVIARAAEGGMRDALSMLDMCIACGAGKVDAALAREVLGATDRETLFDFASALLSGDMPTAMMLIDRAMRDGRDPQVFARDMTGHFRTLLMARTVGGEVAELMELTDEDGTRFIDQAACASGEAQLMRLMELFMRAEGDMKWASIPRAALELAAARACRPEKERSAEALIERLNALEKGTESLPAGDLAVRIEVLERTLREGALIQPAASSSQPREAARPRKAQEGTAATSEAPRPAVPPASDAECYTKAIKALAAVDPRVCMNLKKASFAGLDGATATIEFSKDDSIYLDIVSDPDKKKVIEECLSQSFGRPIRAGFRIKQEAPQPVGRQVIDRIYDAFPRDKVELENK